MNGIFIQGKGVWNNLSVPENIVEWPNIYEKNNWNFHLLGSFVAIFQTHLRYNEMKKVSARNKSASRNVSLTHIFYHRCPLDKKFIKALQFIPRLQMIWHTSADLRYQPYLLLASNLSADVEEGNWSQTCCSW